jgi:SAM-dependent methyltransferase
MPHPSWNDSYTSGEPPPWDIGTPDPMLVAMIGSHTIEPGRTLEVGCGTGTNAIYLAEHGFDVVGVDVAPVAIENARGKAHGRCRFETVDFLNESPPGGPFQFVFDRGCFHTFDNDQERARFAQNVANVLVVGGMWLSLIGSTEGAARDVGPPRRSAREAMNAIEPALEILELAIKVHVRPMSSRLALDNGRTPYIASDAEAGNTQSPRAGHCCDWSYFAA